MLTSSVSPFAHLAGQAAALAAQRTDAPSIAAQIILAGKKARNEVEVTAAPVQQQGHVATPTEIIAAGKRRRGEMLT